MNSLREGGEPLASEAECWEWARAHPREWPPIEGAATKTAPVAIQRRAAFIFLRVMDWPNWRQMQEALHESEMGQAIREDEWAERPPFDVAREEAKWRHWRDGLIRRYRLEGLAGLA